MGSHVYAKDSLYCVVSGKARLSYQKDGLIFDKLELLSGKDAIVRLPLEESQAFYRALRLCFEATNFRDVLLQMLFKSKTKMFPTQHVGIIREKNDWYFIYRSKEFSFKTNEVEALVILADIRSVSSAAQKMLDPRVRTPTCI